MIDWRTWCAMQVGPLTNAFRSDFNNTKCLLADGLTQKELSDLAGVMEPTTFSAIKAMEDMGYVERRQKPENRKNMYVHLTAKGRALKKRLVPLAIDVNHVAVKGVSTADLLITRKVLLALIENLALEEAQDGHV
jgi:DNA-binding MarR family transcriptional regulator